jgi:hypothetical protein
MDREAVKWTFSIPTRQCLLLPDKVQYHQIMSGLLSPGVFKHLNHFLCSTFIFSLHRQSLTDDSPSPVTGGLKDE